MNMIVEQLPQSSKRMIYNAENHSFLESDSDSLLFVRGVPYPYGWIKESGSPPGPHCDCVLVSQADYALGDEVAIKIIGVFQRADGDHKYVVVETDCAAEDLAGLTEKELLELKRLYPRIGRGEGWFGRETALYCYEHCEKAL